ncbi:hypothetical protein [Pseudoalteromonas sp. Z9A5]|uniref:hypothetical protein n=1 Tax=Pseudoalteromonas sp. Z9A5 TaxID=2686355 RepID=UPI00140BD737|nr:hypothetical protein [Pseudoalteromonas sp. Z9A5]
MDYKITTPVLDNIGGYKDLVYVKPDSQENQKDALEQMATYFKREFKFDTLQYCKEEHQEKCTGVIFTERAMDLVETETHYPHKIIGGACFWEQESGDYTLDWIWIHPFARNRKKLKEYWPILKEEFGEFTLSPPISAQMSAFLEKHA